MTLVTHSLVTSALRLLFLVILLATGGRLQAQQSISRFKPIDFSRLSQQPTSRLSEEALAIHPDSWKHSETAHFVYHYSHDRVGGEVASEAEFHYAFFAKDLTRNTSQWERKGQIYIFNEEDAWRAFQKSGNLDPWTGGIHSQNELFIFRPGDRKFAGHTLAHEVAHLVLYRFYGSGIPLWLNEGYAEYAGARSHATYFRMRGYRAHGKSRPISAEALIPLSTFVQTYEYPRDIGQLRVFYQQSERLVRFLSATDRVAFARFLGHMADGNTFESALGKTFLTKFPTVTALERAFTKYVSQEFSATIKTFESESEP